MTRDDPTILFGLIGHPVTHSLSPFIMNRALARLGFEATYVAFGIEPRRLDASFQGLVDMGVAGFNVTYPFKERVLEWVDAVSTAADLVEAANTIVVDDAEIQGFNTDAPGTATALEEFGETALEGKRAFVFGGGAAARAAALGVLSKGASTVTFGVRSPEKGRPLVAKFRYAFSEHGVDYVVLGEPTHRARREQAIRNADVVINATPVGMSALGGTRSVEQTALVENPGWIDRRQCYFDFVYHPSDTLFLETARRRGATTLGGLALLVCQAAESLLLWTGETFDVREMFEAATVFSARRSETQRRIN